MNAVVETSPQSFTALRDESLARHTSWKVGGSADIYCRPRSEEELVAFLKAQREDSPLTFIGLGSNLLIRDGGIRGAVVSTSGLPRTCMRLEANRVRASAGLPCASLARRSARLGLGPAAFFAGIPGTVGGALAMNAGAFGGETWDRVESVETIRRDGSKRTRARAEFDVAYRTVTGAAGEWFLSADFAFDADCDGEAQAIKNLLKRRSDSQPIGSASAGSVFRNPPGLHAGQLIEQAGLKGQRIGDAQVSDKHANFIVNLGSARAADIEALIELVQGTVQSRLGVTLEPEVRIIGEATRE